MSQIDDLLAIDRYISGSKPRTKDAEKVRDAWLRWYTNLSWWERNMDSDTYDKARNLRNDYNLANAVTAAEKTHVEQVIKTGMSTEEMQGEPDRRLSSGRYDEDPDPLISTRGKVYLGLGAALFAAGWLGKAVYIDPLLSRFKR